MNLLEESSIRCPYCGESLDILVDTSLDEQEYIEDCQVCCKPMVIRVGISADGAIRVIARHEDEA
jgi:hypothetical protein